MQQPVDPPEPVLQRGAPRGRRVDVEQVDRLHVEPLLGDAEALDRRPDPVDVEVGERQRRPGAGESLGDHGPEPAADAGDGDHAPLELAHQATTSVAVARRGRPSSAGWSFGASCV